MLDRSRGGFLGGGNAGGVVTGDLTMAAGTKVVLDTGTAAAPSLVFAGSPTSGLYAHTADGLSVARVGASHVAIGSTGMLLVNGALTLPAGTLAAPSLKWTGSDPGTGLSAQTADTLVIGRAGANHVHFNSSGINANVAITANGTLFLNAAFRPTIVATAVDYTLLTSDRAVAATAGCSIITMPASPSVGARWEIWNNTGGVLTLARAGSQTINGATSVSIAAGAHVVLAYTATNVFLAGEAPAA